MNITIFRRLRALSQTLFLLTFPVTLNWFSPYVIVDGAFQGLVTGSALVFAALLLGSPFLGRSWCAWVCPAGTIQDQLSRTNNRPVRGRISRGLKYLIWGLWMGTIAWGFASAGFQALAPLHLTESGISVDGPLKYITYFGVIAIFTLVALPLGRRGACHSICWMAPFMVLGRKVGNALHVPGLRVVPDTGKCTSCNRCEEVCPMSLRIGAMARAGKTEDRDCIQCGECVGSCRSQALSLRFCRPVQEGRDSGSVQRS